MNLKGNIFSPREVSLYCGFSFSTLNRLRCIQDFPKAIQISFRRIGFLRNEVDEWLLNRKRSKVGDLSVSRTKVRCPQTPLEVDQAYDQELAELKKRIGHRNGS